MGKINEREANHRTPWLAASSAAASHHHRLRRHAIRHRHLANRHPHRRDTCPHRRNYDSAQNIRGSEGSKNVTGPTEPSSSAAATAMSKRVAAADYTFAAVDYKNAAEKIRDLKFELYEGERLIRRSGAPLRRIERTRAANG